MISQIKFIKTHKEAVIPTKAGPKEIGWDLTAISVFKKLSDKTTIYDTGICISPPEGYYTEIIPRSSLTKTGHILSNSIGVIDSTYTGNLLIALTRVDDELSNTLTLPFMRVQLVLRKFEDSVLKEVKKLDETYRGDGGFGSTDQK